jgi:WD40 repeat protein
MGRYRHLALDATASRLAVVEGDDPEPVLFTVFGLAEGRNLNFCQSSSGPSCFAFVEDRLLVGRHDGVIEPWALGRGSEQADWIGHRGPVRALVAEPVSGDVASGGEDGTIRVWSPDGSCLRVLSGHRGAVSRLAARRGELWSGSADGTVRVWDTESGCCLKVLEAGAAVGAMALSPDGGQIACGLADGRLMVWETEPYELRCERRLESEEVTGLAWTPTHLVCGGSSGTVSFLDAGSLEHLATFHALEHGTLWTTPPDAAAPNGWLWTDRPELVEVVECEEDGANPRALGPEAAARAEHLQLYNDAQMVLLRLNAPEEYRREVLGQRRLAEAGRRALPERGTAR